MTTASRVTPANSAPRTSGREAPEQQAGRATQPTSSGSALLSIFRFSLAMMVIAYHLSGSAPRQTGYMAVEAFFCISGFLITMIATTTYTGRPTAFLVNRFLRIYPIYWTCLLISLAIVAAVPAGRHFDSFLAIPEGFRQILSNIAIFGVNDAAVRLLPPAWSLNTELWFYLIIGLVTASRPRLTLLCCGASVVLALLSITKIIPIPFYGDPIGNGEAFFIGSLAWQYRGRPTPAVAFMLLTGALAVFWMLSFGPVLVKQTANVILAAPVIAVALAALRHTEIAIPPRIYPVCGFLGKISYPMFLLHIPIAVLVCGLTGLERGIPLFLIASAATLLGSGLLHITLERLLDRMRTSIRTRSGFSSPAVESNDPILRV